MNEDFQILKKNGQIDLTRKAVVVIERAEQLPQWREFMVSAACLCADKIIISSYSEDLYGPIFFWTRANVVYFVHLFREEE